MSNHILFFLSDMLGSLLWRSSVCLIIRYFLTVRSAVENQAHLQVFLSYIYALLLYTDCILVIRYADGGRKSDRNILMNNNM